MNDYHTVDAVADAVAAWLETHPVFEDSELVEFIQSLKG